MVDRCSHCGKPIPPSDLDPDWCIECGDSANDNDDWEYRRDLHKVFEETESW